MLSLKFARGLLAGLGTSVVCAITASTALAQDVEQLESLVFYPTPLVPGQEPAALANAPLAGASLLALNESTAGGVLETPAIIEHLNAIVALEASEGAYAPALFEHLVQAGRLYQRQGEHAKALELLERASLISTTSNGPFAPEQISLTDSIIASLTATGQLEAVEEKHEYLVRLHQQYSGEAGAATVNALQDLGEWKLRSFHRTLVLPDQSRMVVARDNGSLFTDYQVYSSEYEDLRDAQASFENALDVLTDAEAWTDPRLYELEQDLIKTFFINANRELLMNVPMAPEGAEAGPDLQPSFEDYKKGVDAYVRTVNYLQRNPDATVQQLADTMLALADWHLIFGKFDRAQEQYTQLEHLLAKVELAPEQIARLMRPRVPQTLPTFFDAAIAAAPLDDASQYSGYVDLTLNLNRFGRVTDVVVLDSSANTSGAIEDRLVGLIRNAQFRPVGGRAVTPSIRYYYSY